MRKSISSLSAAVFVVMGVLSSASLRAQAVLTPGSNLRGYVEQRVGGSFTFTSNCAASGFVAGTVDYDVGNRTISEGTGCTHDGWYGTSIMNSAARTLQSYTSVTVTDPAALHNNGVTGVVALSRVIFLDAVYISSGGAIPDSISFTFDLHGTQTTSLGPNTATAPAANFDMGWDSNISPTLTFTVQPSGSYYFAFAVTPDMIDRYVPFWTNLQTFANVLVADPGFEFSGTATTDYAHTLNLIQTQFLDGTGSGPGQNITNSVNATFQSGANLTSATPEPASIVLVASGLACVAALGRRRAKRCR